MNDIKKGIQYAFQTENNMTIAMSGSGHAAMECAVFNVVEPGESVLVAINGIWGERVAEIAERMGEIYQTPHLVDEIFCFLCHFESNFAHLNVIFFVGRCKCTHNSENAWRILYQ